MKKFFSTLISLIIITVLVVCLVAVCMVIYSLFQEDNNQIRKIVGEAYNAVESLFIDPKDKVNNEKIELISGATQGSPVTKYYYDQLDDYAKIIYSKLEIEKDNLKKGTYKIEFGNTFDELLSQENGSDLLGDYYQSAIETFLYDNPDIFYIEPSKMYINIQKTTKPFKVVYNVYVDSGKELNYLTNDFSTEYEIETAINEIEKVRKDVLSSVEDIGIYNKILKIHDYLVNSINYDVTVSKKNIYNIYGALVNKDCVCEGYAKAFKYLLNEAGIQNVIVIGTAVNSKGVTENHAWNYVLLGDTWYAVDVTWDDPLVKGSGYLPQSYKYKYFLVGSETISKDHTYIKKFTEGGRDYEYPTISLKDYENR